MFGHVSINLLHERHWTFVDFVRGRHGITRPNKSHKPFWDKVKKHIEIEDPTPVDRILGKMTDTAMQFSVEDFAENVCKAYEELSGCTLKTASTPFLPEGSLVDSDFETHGQMARDASKMLMRFFWSARLARPDLMKGISDLTRRITTWSKTDDRRFRLMSYPKRYCWICLRR